ncbi:MAG: asparagine synthase (glutamine-hydrolyzing) [Desulfovibrionaceae bacterium]
MCGICGIWTPRGLAQDELAALAGRMADRLLHRGPDDGGAWADARRGMALGHRRLAILDLSPLGHQPMLSRCGRFVLCFNGEVYNHLELRAELEREGHTFRGGSDTETMLAAFASWGLRAAVERFVGMFAFALCDLERGRLHLVRDRMGIKPLYWGSVGGDFAFASELKALRALPGFDNPVDRDSLALYFRHNYIPAPYSIHRGIFKLEPGTILTLDAPGADPRVETWWSTREVMLQGAAHPLACTREEAADRLEELLGDAVSLRMLSDVPIGAFLSGGIDSSLVAALMRSRSTAPVRTFSIGFHESGYNEADHAKAVAAHLGTEHTELYVTPRDLLDTVPDVPRHWDEPFGDSSQIPTLLLSRLTREHVTVALSGDGGDELFFGYERHLFISRIWQAVGRVPLPLRRAAARLGRAAPEPCWRLLGSLGPKIHWRIEALGARDFVELYRFLFSHHKRPEAFVRGGAEPPTAFTRAPRELDALDPCQAMGLLDLEAYLPDDILTKVDRASMAASLEARVPLLDHRVVAFAARVPTAWKVADGEGKSLLRQVLHRHVPRALVDRPKMGFGVPVDRWMRHELRDWCETLLDERRLREQGFIDAAEVRRMWAEYLGGQRNWFAPLWNVLMFQAWLEEAR